MNTQTTFGTRLRGLRVDRGLSTAELAERASISAGYVRALEVGAKPQPHTDTLIRLADVLGVSTDELLGRAPLSETARQARVLELLEHEVVERRLQGEIAIGVIGSVPASGFRWMWQEGEVETVSVPRSMLQGRSQREVFGLRVRGDCLRALLIADGDIVLCAWANGRRPENGDLVVVRLAGELTLKLWYWRGDEVELRDGDGQVIWRGRPSEELLVEGFVLGLERVGAGLTRERP